MDLSKEPEMPKMMGFKVTTEKYEEIVNFCSERDYNMSKFIRFAIDESIAKIVKKENK